jgi:hypothetical protein
MSARCQFPNGEPGRPDYRVCGKPVARPGQPYCEAHARQAHAPPDRRPAILRKSPSSRGQGGAQKRRRVGGTAILIQ